MTTQEQEDDLALVVAQKIQEIKEKEKRFTTLFSCIEDHHIQQFHAGKGMEAVLGGLSSCNKSQMRLGAIILHEVHLEASQN